MSNSKPYIELCFPFFVHQAEPSSWYALLEQDFPSIRWYKYHGFKKLKPKDPKFNWIEVIVHGLKCQVEDCPKIATYASQGATTHCEDHKHNSLDCARAGKCEIQDCTRIPTHGFPAMAAKFCKYHAPEAAERHVPRLPSTISVVNADGTPREQDDELKVEFWGGSYFVRIDKSTQRSGIQHDQIRLEIRLDATGSVAYSRPIEVWTRDDKLFPSKSSPKRSKNRINNPELPKRPRLNIINAELTDRSACPSNELIIGGQDIHDTKETTCEALQNEIKLLHQKVEMLQKENELLRIENKELKSLDPMIDSFLEDPEAFSETLELVTREMRNHSSDSHQAADSFEVSPIEDNLDDFNESADSSDDFDELFQPLSNGFDICSFQERSSNNLAVKS